jgi:hypothetical protein
VSLNLQQRKELLVRLGEYLLSNEPEWQHAKEKAFRENRWFIPEFIDLALINVANGFLREDKINQLIEHYSIPNEKTSPKKVGIVMAGNIPLVGFHDLFCVFLSGHIAIVKPSSKDDALIRHLVSKLIEWNEQVGAVITLRDMLKNCDAYIATGSNNTSRYFEYYFRNYPSIIRKNRTSVAILKGDETEEELQQLADDVYLYFGLGCRNVTKLFVPEGYDFVPLLNAFKKYDHLANHHKYKNNYDYNLAIHILNKTYYMTNESILLIQLENPFSPIGQLNYEYYTDEKELQDKLRGDERIQCIVGRTNTGFGKAQCPAVTDYADGVDTLQFLMSL